MKVGSLVKNKHTDNIGLVVKEYRHLNGKDVLKVHFWLYEDGKIKQLKEPGFHYKDSLEHYHDFDLHV